MGLVTFSWTPLAGIARYLFEFTGPDQTFATGAVGSLPVEGTNLTVTVPPATPAGSYQVRVSGLSATGQPVGRVSEALTLAVP